MSTAKRKKRSSSLKGSLNPSKRHRDRFNVELDNLAKLLPFPNDVIQKLDKLSILRLSASYLRAKNFFKEQHWTDPGEQSSIEKAVAKKDYQIEGNGFFSKLLLEALDGFVIVLTQDYELFYASETIQDYLGLSQSSVIHQDFLRFIHVDDHELVKRNLQPHLEEAEEKKIKILDDENDGDPSKAPKHEEETSSETGSLSREVHTERTFTCRMKCILNTSAGFFKPFKCNGRLREMTLPDSDKREYGLFLICTPMETMSTSILEIRLKTSLFCSKNRMDLSFVDIDQKGRALLGYHKRDIALQSSYCMIHFEDIAVLKNLHVDLMSTGKCQGTFRILNKNMKWQWLTGTAQVVYKGNEADFVITTNRPLSEEEGEEVLRQRGQPTPALQFTTADNSHSPKDNNSFQYFMGPSKNDQNFKYPVPPNFFPDNKKRPQPPNVNGGNGLHHQGYFNRGPPSSGTDGTLSPQANLSSFSDDGFSSTACTSAPDSPEDLNLGVDLQDELMTDGSDFTFLSQDFPLDPDPVFDPAKDTELVDHMSQLAMDPAFGDLPTLEETIALMQNCISSDSESTAPSLTSSNGSFVSAHSPPHVNCDPFSPTSSVGQPSPFLSPVGSQVNGPSMMSPSGMPTPEPSPLGRREGDPARVNISWQGVSKGRSQNPMQQQQRHPLPQQQHQQHQQQHSPYGHCSPNHQPSMNSPNGNVLCSKSAYMAAVKKREMENYPSCVGNVTNPLYGQNVPSSWRMQQCSPSGQPTSMQTSYNNWNSNYQQRYRSMNSMHGKDHLPIGNVQTQDQSWNQGIQGAMSVPPTFEDTLPNLDYSGSNVLSPPYQNEGMPGYGFSNKHVPVTSVSKHGGW